MKKSVLFFLLASTLGFAQQMANGYVFVDANKNGKKEKSEKGLPNVAVSNGKDVVMTDSKGKYTLSVSDDTALFVIKPEGYKTTLDAYNLPQYYYLHKPAGSPKGTKYEGVAPTGPLPKEVNFALQPSQENKDFRIVVFGDPQPYTEKEIDYFRRGIINEVKNTKKNAVFGISLGDLVGDNLSFHPHYKDAVKEIGLPWYNVMGNHDMNYEAKDDKLSDETFEANFGPNNYAFNYGNVHFLVLDDIIYPDPRDSKGYQGGFREDQLQFIENDLKHVDKNKLIVLSFHIQLMAEEESDHFRKADRQRLFDILKPFPNILMMSAHTHKQSQLFYTKKHGWDGFKELHEYNVGTTSGDWYSGTADAVGVPKSTMRDGTERGYSFIDFKDNEYKISYKVAGEKDDYQIAVYAPKVVPYQTRTSARVYANFFLGSKKDKVEYRFDQGEWKAMDYTETFDPDYLYNLQNWDKSSELPIGKRPSNPEMSRHLWSAPFSNKLPLGVHTVEIRATDQYNRVHTTSQTFEVKEGKKIP